MYREAGYLPRVYGRAYTGWYIPTRVQGGHSREVYTHPGRLGREVLRRFIPTQGG